MNRRYILKGALAAAALTVINPAKAADEALTYTPELYQELLASGEPFMLDFFATWCSTCRTQERTISTIKNANPDYANVKVVKVDWDQHGNSELSKSLAIPRRSTLVMFKDGKELSRVVAQTGAEPIEALFAAAIL